MDLGAAARALALVALAGCQAGGPAPVVTLDMRVSLDEVYVPRGGGAVPVAQVVDGLGDDDPLFTSVRVPLGADFMGPEGCKQLPVHWLPSSLEEETPTTDRRASLCARMPLVTLGGWRAARARFAVAPVNPDAYLVSLEAEHLVPDAVYSVWAIYLRADKRYALAPLGGAPNLILSDPSGAGRFERRVSSRALREGSLLINAVSTAALTAPAGVIEPDTTITVALYYHSNAQSNGNASAINPRRPPGRVLLVGETGVDAHLHLTGAMPALR